MKMNVDGININYIRYGKVGAKALVFLHGWGQNIAMMKPVADNFSDDYDIVIVDLPGFGQSEEPKKAYEVIDYVEIIHEFLTKLNINNPVLVGHSFGGKISLLYASKYEVNKLVLFAPPFTKEIKKDNLKVKLLKTAKKIPGIKSLEEFAKKHMGSTDYRNASSIMRQILVNTVNTDIKEEVKKIKASAILIWGTEDEAVDISRGYELESLISDAALIAYEGLTHYAYLEDLNKTVNIMRSFLGGN